MMSLQVAAELLTDEARNLGESCSHSSVVELLAKAIECEAEGEDVFLWRCGTETKVFLDAVAVYLDAMNNRKLELEHPEEMMWASYGS